MADSIHEEEVLGKAYDARLIKRLAPYARPYLKLVIAGVFFMLLAAGVELCIPRVIREIVNGPFNMLAAEGDSAPAYNLLAWLALAYLGLVIVQFISQFAEAYLFQTLGQRAIFDLRHDLYARIQDYPLRFFDKNPVGRLVTRMTSDVEAIGEVFASGFVQLMGDMIVVLGALAMMFALSVPLTLIVIGALPVMGAITWIFRGRARNSFRDMRTKLASVNSFLNESVQGWRVTRIFGIERRQAARFDGRSRDFRDASYQTVFNFALFFPVVEIAGTLTIMVLVWYGARSILGGTLDAGTFFAFFFYTQMMFRPIREISEKYNVLQSAMASAERLFKIMDFGNDIKDPPQPKTPAIKGEIEFRNVWFAYDGDSGAGASPASGAAEAATPRWVLRDVSFKVPAGSSLALVGATGSGKSTIIALVMRFYDVQKGAVLIDGVDVREMTREHLRKAFSLVLQDVFLFAGNVFNNIRLGDETISRERVKEAARTVHADDFIDRLPEQYDSPVAERGATFSAGQRQLLAFARALAFDPRILLLDEATSNIDSETEALIQDALGKLMKDRTTIAVAHRLSTITASDNIVVLHKGEIAEQGSHEKLMAAAGRYSKLYRLQFSDEEPLKLGSGAGSGSEKAT
ncbi:MAG: ABC transporter ATP-binding protein [Planctomycetes bacterium]|nr:ABC transporter ATP-binding protein [Planctomycetota bacterium]